MPANDSGNKVVIAGAGAVGSTFAFNLMLSGLASEIVLIDLNREKAEGEAMDLRHALPFAHPTRVSAGTEEDYAGADIVVISAGVAQKPGETRLDLLKRNTAVFRSIIDQITRHNRDCIILVATNPVDILSYAAWKLSGFPTSRVLGSGTILDTARLRYVLGRRYGVDPRSVHAYILGEHGDSEVPAWSLVSIGGVPLWEFPGYDPADHERLFEEVRDAAYEIIRRKGATFYAIAAGLTRIVESILRDQHSVLSVSTWVDGYLGIEGVYLGLPSVVSRRGVERVLHLPLNDEEAAALRESASLLKDQAESLEL